MNYFHGGQAGLRVGQLLLPPTETGVVAVIDSLPSGDPLRERAAHVRRDRVFLTNDVRIAEMFAAMHPFGTARRGGDVYEVEPLGVVEPDPDLSTGSPRNSWQCDRARITRIVRRAFSPEIAATHDGAP